MSILQSLRMRSAVSLLPVLQKTLPKTQSFVGGFSIGVERKNGCVLRSRPKDSPEGTSYTDIGVDEHFEVTVTYDGSHPLYRNVKKGPRMYLLTTSKEKSGLGFAGAVHYYPLGSKFEKVEVREEYEDWRGADCFGRGRPGPEHVVWLVITVKTPDRNQGPLKVGLASRPARQ